jgi:hypothetical protein
MAPFERASIERYQTVQKLRTLNGTNGARIHLLEPIKATSARPAKILWKI